MSLSICCNKDQQVFNSSPELKVPITVEDEVSFISKYSLLASINYSGTLDQGHYWAVVKNLNSGNWLSCNYKIILTVITQLHTPFSQENLSIANFVQGGFVFFNIAFGCDDSIYCPSPGRGIDFAHSIFRNLHPCKTLVFMRRIASGPANLG